MSGARSKRPVRSPRRSAHRPTPSRPLSSAGETPKGGYSLRQSPESATKYDAYFERRRIGSVRGPFSGRDGKSSFYDWTLVGPRGQATGRARTQTAAFNELIRKHKEWRAIGADTSQVSEATRGVREKLSMTYGELPSFNDFKRDVRTRIDPERNGNVVYWPKGTDYPMELVSAHEIELAQEYGGLNEFDTSRPGYAFGFRGDEQAIYDFVRFLKEKWEEGDEEAGDLASSIMYTLGYEWI